MLIIPETSVEVARLTTRYGRILLKAFKQSEGTYGYTAEGAGGSGLSLMDVVHCISDAREWPGGKTATLTIAGTLESADIAVALLVPVSNLA